ncbi:alpha/beta fold hydrolase [Pseudonocardia acidicola]|uniref:Alpha/beta hydrolase n=1 Tax=Pseudonocardia acidicola TaxID=2724939 RepID=A0ABX1SBV0_9PSEU|nr:alpha/beta hydrolase [Pseudonocardia acidicola]NMH98287.1 alpha/beta hydrolase [Pseudonocardia acidicola]
MRTSGSSRGRRRAAALVTTAVLAGAGVALTAGPASAGPASDPRAVADSVAPDNGRTCTTSRLPVDLEVGLPPAPGSGLGVPLGDTLGQQQVVVKLCLPEGKPTPDTVQVLVHGITYDHRYWNIADPDDPQGDRYSWEAAAAKAGYATAAIDRIGNGDSTRPVSAAINIDSNATAVHQVVQALREGRIESPGERAAFDKVALVGHSYGSMTSFIEASRYQDVDALVLTGVSHNIREVQTPTAIESKHYPAALDPQFQGSMPDPGYITSRPGTRYDLFYAPGTDVDQRIVERDEATKGTVTQTELANYPIIFRTPLDVRAPVFIINGSLDGIFCSQGPLDLGAPCSTPQSLIENERPWFGPDVPSIDAHITEGAGHDLNAFRTSQESFAASMDWLSGKVPARS